MTDVQVGVEELLNAAVAQAAEDYRICLKKIFKGKGSKRCHWQTHYTTFDEEKRNIEEFMVTLLGEGRAEYVLRKIQKTLDNIID